jgi:hypothetical protein
LLTTLVGGGHFIGQHAPAGNGVGDALAGGGEAIGQGVARAYRGLELDAVAAGGRATDAGLLAERAQAVGLGEQGIDHESLADHGSVGAGGHEAAKGAMAGGFRIGMEILRIIDLGVGDDRILGEAVITQWEHFALVDIFEPAGHWPAPSWREEVS